MRIVLQSLGSRRFLRELNSWTTDVNSALGFPTSMGALRYCHAHGLENVQIVVFFSDRRPPLAVPVNDRAALVSPAPSAQVSVIAGK